MRRALVSLALVFALILAGAAALISWSERGQRQTAGDGTENPARIASGDTGSPPAADAEDAPSAQSTPAVPSGGVAASQDNPARGPRTFGPGQENPASDATEAAPTEPSFDVVRVEPTGDALIAGRAPPGAPLEVVVDGAVVAEAKADESGAFVAIPGAPLTPGDHMMTLRVAGTTEPAGPEQTLAVAVPKPGEGAAEITAGEQQVAAADTQAGAAGGGVATPGADGSGPGGAAGGAQDPGAPGIPEQQGGAGPSAADPSSADSAAAEATAAGSAAGAADGAATGAESGQGTPGTEPGQDAPGTDAGSGQGGPQPGGGNVAGAGGSGAGLDVPGQGGTRAGPGSPERENGAAGAGAGAVTAPGKGDAPATANGGAAGANDDPAGATPSIGGTAAPAGGGVAGAAAGPGGKVPGAAGVDAGAGAAGAGAASGAAETGSPAPGTSAPGTAAPGRETAAVDGELTDQGASGSTPDGTPGSSTGDPQAPTAGQADGPAIASAAPGGDGSGADSAGPRISIKAAEAEARNLYVAGEAAPGTLVRVYADDALVGEAEAGEHGTWLVEGQKEVPLGNVVIRADAAARDTETVTAQAALPFIRYADGLVLEPAVTATEERGDVPALNAAATQPTFVIIRRGDNLWRISRRKYGRGIRYESIFAANRDLIRNPDRIYPGQAFILPQRDRDWEAPTN